MWLNARDAFMILSNAAYLPIGVGYAWKGLWVDALLRVLVFVFSNNYHICYRKVHDEDRVSLDDLCVFSLNNIFFTILIDEVFANMAAFSALTKLLPADLNTPRGIRYWYTAIAGVLVWLTTLWNGAFFTYDFFADNSSQIIVTIGSFFLLLFLIHLYIYGWTQTKRLYAVLFRVYLLPFAVGALFIGIFVWHSVNRIFNISYFWSHPLWHFITQVADLTVLIGIRSDTNILPF